MTMSLALLVAGFVQTYLWRIIGMDFMEVHLLLNSYLWIRALGGAMFTLGDLLLFWFIFKAWQATRPKQ